MIFNGFIAWMLVILIVVSLFIYFERLVDLRRAQIDYQDFMKGIVNILDAGNDEEALAICEDTPAPVASVVATAIRHADGSARLLREAVDSQGRAEIGRLDRRLASLAIIAQVSPLLGLLGTIIGFIKTVLVSDAQDVASRADLFNGSMESLVCAAIGIIVSILASVMYGSLRVRLDRTVVELEAAASQIVGYVSTHRGDQHK